MLFRSQIAAALTKSRDAKITAAGQSLAGKLTAVEGEIYQYRNRSSQDPLNYPIRLNNKLAALQTLVEFGDNKPTDQSYAVFEDLSERLGTQLAGLDAIVRTELAGLNRMLVRKKLPAIDAALPPR